MSQTAVAEQVFDFKGGVLCLDFANTLGDERAHPKEHLTSYGDLVVWGQQAGLLTNGEAHHLIRLAAQRPRDAARTLAGAIALREALYRIFSAVIDGSSAAEADLAILNAALPKALDHLRLAPRSAGRFEWVWVADGDALDRMLWPVLRSAADLLVSDDIGRVRRCAGDGCDWLFLDTSRNRSRRWCDMRQCGNRAKARRHYARKKASG